MIEETLGARHFLEHDGERIAYHVMGDGPPLLLLHGYPQNVAMWARIAPELARDFTVISADLRGYGASSKPADMARMSFRAMAADMSALMQALGFARFFVAGHDRGGRVAHRLALDAAERVAGLAVMDIVPTHHLLSQLDHGIARAYYHWFFLAQPAPFPETMIGHDPDAFYERCLLGFGKARLSDFEPDMLAAYRVQWHDPAFTRASCNDYRAAIEIDFHDDAADLHRQVACPSLVLYGAQGAMAQALDVPGTWRARLTQMQAKAVPGGHFFPDQSAQETAEALRRFFAALKG